MPTSFIGLFLFSTTLSLIATFTAVAAMAIGRRLRNAFDPDRPRIG
jgi:hypothetical protein